MAQIRATVEVKEEKEEEEEKEKARIKRRINQHKINQLRSSLDYDLFSVECIFATVDGRDCLREKNVANSCEAEGGATGNAWTFGGNAKFTLTPFSAGWPLWRCSLVPLPLPLPFVAITCMNAPSLRWSRNARNLAVFRESRVSADLDRTSGFVATGPALH